MAPYYEGKWSGLTYKQKIASVAKHALHEIKAMGGPAGERADIALQQIAKIRFSQQRAEARKK